MDASDWISLAALVLSGWATFRAWVTRNDGKELQKLQKIVAEHEAQLTQSAQVSVTIIEPEKSSYRLQVSNNGLRTAKEISIKFKSANEHPLPESLSDLKNIPAISAKNKIDYPITVMTGDSYDYHAEWSWVNPNDKSVTDKATLRIPGVTGTHRPGPRYDPIAW